MPSPPPKRVKKELKPLSSRPQFAISSFAPKLPSSSMPPPPVPSTSSKGKGKAKQVEVLDLTEDEVEEQDPEALWVDRFAPSTRDELGVHPKKVNDVAGWLDEAYNPRLSKYRRLLVMSGPSGAAKTATLKILADELDIDILEYRNGSNFTFASDDSRDSMVEQFTSFLARAGMAPALELGPDPSLPPPPSSSSSSSSAPLPPSTRSKRLILLEDLPNTSHYPTKLALRSALQQYLASPRVTCPLVVIVSEALARPGVGLDAESTSGEGRRGESVDARSVCGIDVLQAPGCREISFNPIAVTIMKKALTKILDRVYASKSSGGLLPTSARPAVGTLEIIIAHSNGDIRSALMSLQFLASNPELAAATGATLLGAGKETGKGKKRKSDGEVKGAASKAQVKKLLQYVTARESSLFIFHALGKVLYSKRWGESADDDKKDLDRQGIQQEQEIDRLPKHLRKEWTRKPSKVNPDVLFAEAPIDSDVFLSYMHHNYTAFTNDIDECLGIVEGMSTADGLMRLEGEDWLQRVSLTSQYSFNTAVRSTLLHLPSPVPRRKQVLRKSALWEKMRETRANEEGIEEMYRKKDGIALVPPFEFEAGEEDGGGWRGGGGSQRSRRSLTTELVPYVGVIRQKGTKGALSFFTELATFPPVPSSHYQATITGETLGEKDVDEDEDLAVVKEEPEDEEMAEAEAEVLKLEEEEEAVGELLWDPEDDIEDD
ncbi:Rad17 cell cycle checkpoint protein-domain-containing protein [Leucosporidium creatinivorum]|uniref:Rad17 cell cycle checkpoint protein-domain-containing protein n=1 Tax=Leucosporidium creatinivorum TaxID=106004 RepID=A0A1Y2G0C8_9BASI|nr:Rad17 cell cycle checkpoint protein-domain-containing protein [Leucosporidium creatinivorum]